MRLAGKSALVTGAAFGLGQAVAMRFAGEGAAVLVTDIDAEAAEALAASIVEAGGRAVAQVLDVSQEDQVSAAVDAAMRHFGRIDILYNNAAVLLYGKEARAHELTTEVWDRTMDVNLRGAWLCSKYALRCMLEQGSGNIIHVASPTGLTGCAPGVTAYSSSKGGLFALTRVMAVDYAADNIRVNAIVPGTMDTPMNAPVLGDPGARETLLKRIPMKRVGQPEDIAGLATFLASDDAAYCTGGVYMADGGLMAW